MSPQTLTVTESAYRAVEKAAGILSPDYQFRADLDRCIQKWRNQRTPDLTNAKLAKLGTAISKIRTHARQLLNDLNRASGDDQDAWDYKGAITELLLEDNLAEELQRVVKIADDWLDAQPKSTIGRPAKDVLQCLIALYERHTPAGHRGLTKFLELSRDRFSLPFPLNRESLKREAARYRTKVKRGIDKTTYQ